LWLGVYIGGFFSRRATARWVRRRAAANRPTTHGSASFATRADVLAHSAEHQAGIGLGWIAEVHADGSPGKAPPALLKHAGHLVVCAPSGAGKSRFIATGALLSWPEGGKGSAFVLDLKGELALVTARRRREMRQEVQIIDPFGVTGKESASVNWIDFLDPTNPDVVSDAALLAEMLCVSEQEASSDGAAHFQETAQELLRGLLVYVATLKETERRTMAEVRRILTSPPEEFAETIKRMQASKEGFEIPARAANSLLSKPERERGSVLSTAGRHTAFLDDPRIAATVARSTFNLGALKERPITVYVALPPNKLPMNKRYVRGLLGLAMLGLMRDATPAQHETLFLLDEFPQLGHLGLVENTLLPVGRGYKARLLLFVQDLSQLQEVYGKWRTFFSSAGSIFFGTAAGDRFTCEHISKALGTYTLVRTVTTRNDGGGILLVAGGKGTASTSTSEQFEERPLMTPDEVGRLERRVGLAFLGSKRPFAFRLRDYLTDPEFTGQFDENPRESRRVG
jgi:type IV secretion system protein VirD4